MAPDEGLGLGVGQPGEVQHVPGEQVAGEPGPHERGAQLGLVAAEQPGEGREQAVGEEALDEVGGLVLGGGRPQQADERLPGLGVLEGGDDELGQPVPDVLRPVGEEVADEGVGPEGDVEDAEEEVLLAAEVVRDEPGVDVGLARHGPQRGARVAVLGELVLGGGGDRLPGVAPRGSTPACSRHLSSSVSGRPRLEASMFLPGGAA